MLKGRAGRRDCDMFHSRLAAVVAAGTDLLQERPPSLLPIEPRQPSEADSLSLAGLS